MISNYESVKNDPKCEMTFDTTSFVTKEQLCEAIKCWVTDKEIALKTYGPINKWDVSRITDMSFLFAAVSYDDDDYETMSKFYKFNEAATVPQDAKTKKMFQEAHRMRRYLMPPMVLASA